MIEDEGDQARISRALFEKEPGASARVSQSQRQAKALVSTLHEDEVAMLRHLVAGWSKADSAAELGFEPHQFEKRRAGLLAKLNACSTTNAIRVGIYAGLD